MRPLHGLASKEMDFAAAFLKKRYELSKTMDDDRLIDRVLFDTETKNAVASSLGISYSYMQYIFKKMREGGIINGKRIDPQYLPAYESGTPVRWMFIFKNNVR
jgi:predicted transcriptional regulator